MNMVNPVFCAREYGILGSDRHVVPRVKEENLLRKLQSVRPHFRGNPPQENECGSKVEYHY